LRGGVGDNVRIPLLPLRCSVIYCDHILTEGFVGEGLNVKEMGEDEPGGCMDRGIFNEPCTEIRAYFVKRNSLTSMCDEPAIKEYYCCKSCS